MILKKLGKNIRSLLAVVWGVVSVPFYMSLICLISLFSISIGYALGRFWFLQIMIIGGITITVYGLEKLEETKNYVYLANHLSYLDIMAMMLCFPQDITFIAKRSLFFIPFVGWAIKMLGNIGIKRTKPREAKKALEKAYQLIKEKKKSIYAFPEGTRSLTGEMGPFKLGPFSLAMGADLDIVPIGLRGTDYVMPKTSYRIKSGNIVLKIAEPKSIASYDRTEKYKLMEETRDIIATML